MKVKPISKLGAVVCFISMLAFVEFGRLFLGPHSPDNKKTCSNADREPFSHRLGTTVDDYWCPSYRTLLH